MRAKEFIVEAVKQRLDPKCWKGKHKEGTKIKGGIRVNNCVPNQGVAEGLGKQIHGTFQGMGDSFGDAHLAKGISYFLQGRHQEGENMLRSKIPEKAQNIVFSKLKTLQAQSGLDVNKNPNIQKYIDDKLVPWVKSQIQQGVAEGVNENAEQLSVGDPVIITGHGIEFEGKTGDIDSFGNMKRFVVVNLYNHGKHSFHSSDVSYNDYADQEDDLDQEFDLIENIIENLAKNNGVDAEAIWEDLESLSDDELYVFATTTTITESEAWQKANKKDKTDGMSQKAVNSYRRAHPGSKLKTAVTTKPGKLKKGSKASKRRKSYCSRSRGQMKMHSISCAKTPDKAICKARRRWNC